MESLVSKFSPIIYLHPEELFYPVDIDWLLKYSTLKDFNDNTIIKSPKQRDLYDIAKKYNFQARKDGDVVLNFSQDSYKGQTPVSDVPVYALVREMNDKVYITYIILFAYNGSYNIAGLADVGEHPGDMEHITVEASKDGTLLRVFFSAHGVKDGRWVKAEDVETENGKIVGYNAVNGHGLYPSEGIAFRFGGAANDTLVKGNKWEPVSKIIYLKDNPKFNIDTMGWTVYNSRFGGSLDKPNTEGITGLPDKGWIENIDNIDETFYKPPPIFAGKKENVYLSISSVLKIIGLYLGIYILIKIFHNKTLSLTIKEHILVILAILIIRSIFKKSFTTILNKYV
jgi:hypothetical protein